jgi:hypothetical protein
MTARAIGCWICVVSPPAEFFLFGTANTEPLHVFVAPYFGFGKFAVFLNDDSYRQSRKTQAKYDN